MKVLKDNFTKETHVEKKVDHYPKFHICDNCGSELEYEKPDLHMGFLGCMHLTCPLCGNENMMETSEGTITLTKDNVKFPTHFWHTSEETGAVDCCNNEEIKKCIDRAIRYFRENKDDYNWYTCYGNLYVSVSRYEGDETYEVTVSDNYYETSIPFEEEDYREEDRYEW